MRNNTRAATIRVAAALVAATMLATSLVGCGDDEGSGPTAGSGNESASGEPSDDHTAASPSDSPSTSVSLSQPPNDYLSTEVTGHELVADTRIRLDFEKDTMSVNAGCNTMFGLYEQTDTGFGWADQPAQTMMGCPDDLSAQDAWLAEVFTSGVEMSRGESGMTVTAGDVTIEFAWVPAEDLQGLLGKTWRATGTMADGVTELVPRVVRTPKIVVGQNGLGRIDTGCNTGRITLTVDETSIDFGHPATTRKSCGEPARTVEQRMLQTVDGRSDYVIFDGTLLIVAKGSSGMVFTVR